MRYSLVVSNDEGKSIDISNYGNTLGYELDENKLQDICEFTSSFESEEALMEILIYSGLIDPAFVSGTFNIKFYKNKQNDAYILPYGVPYKEDRYFFDLENLKNYYYRNLKDSTFFNLFLNKFYNLLKDKEAFSYLLNNIKESFKEFPKKGYVPNETYEDLEMFLNKYAISKNKNGKYQINFRKLTDLAMFASQYEKKYKRETKRNVFQDKFYRQNIINEIGHFDTLLKESGITKEEADAYINAIYKLEQELELLNGTNGLVLRRSLEDGITEN